MTLENSEALGPHTLFKKAQHALKQGDWDVFYACLDRKDVLLLARNSLNVMLSGPPDQALQALYERFDFPIAALEAALANQDWTLFKAQMNRGLRGINNLPTFAAALERHARRLRGGGSVSSSLFAEESLQEVEVRGKHAWGMRYHPTSAPEPVGFVEKKGQWYVRLLARRPRNW